MRQIFAASVIQEGPKPSLPGTALLKVQSYFIVDMVVLGLSRPVCLKEEKD